jgi:hypothetical protein
MKYSSATLRLFTLEKSVGFISTALEVEPSLCSLIGEPVLPSKPDGDKFSQSVWMLDSKHDESEPLDVHISSLCDQIRRRMDEFTAIKGRLESGDFFCMFSSESGQGSCIISSHNLSLIGACGMDLIIDLYPPDGEAVEASLENSSAE